MPVRSSNTKDSSEVVKDYSGEMEGPEIWHMSSEKWVGIKYGEIESTDNFQLKLFFTPMMPFSIYSLGVTVKTSCEGCCPQRPPIHLE